MKGPSDRARQASAAGVIVALTLLVSAALGPAQGRAQDAAPSEVDEGPSATPSASAPVRARTDADPPEDELDPSVDSGPTLAQREAAARRGHPLDRPSYAGDPSEPDLPVAVTLALGGGAGVAGTTFDTFLASHDYASSSGFYLGDVTVLGRALDWLYVGGRFGGRARTFVRNDGLGGSAGAVDLQAIVMIRFQLGRLIDLGVHGGVGAAVVGIALHENASNGVAPRATAGVHIGFRLTRGLRILLRGSYDFCRWFGIDRYGDELELGGLSGVLGIEVRS